MITLPFPSQLFYSGLTGFLGEIPPKLEYLLHCYYHRHWKTVTMVVLNKNENL